MLVVVDPTLVRRTPSLVDVDSLAVIVALLTVSRGVELSGFFSRAAPKIIKLSGGSPQRLTLLLVLAVAASSAVIMNDTAMFIFVPLVVTVSRMTGMSRARAVTLTAIAANVGSALTPIGNPQNVIVWRSYGVHPLAFIAGMAPHVTAWLALLTVAVLLTHRGEKGIRVPPMPSVRVKKVLLAASVALLVADIVLAQLGYPIIALGLTLAVLAVVGREAILSLDLALIAVFTLIFVDFREVAYLTSAYGTHSLAALTPPALSVVAALLSQGVSNVPATVMLASAAPHPPWLPLTVGVNVGGTGTVVGSLANLIAVRLGRVKLREFHKYSIPFFLACLAASVLILAVATGWRHT